MPMSMASCTALFVVAAVAGATLPIVPPVPPAPPVPLASAARSDFDVLVIGAGTAGVEAAIAAASYGRRVGLVERHARITGAPTGAHSKEMREAVYEGARTFADVSKVITAAGDRAQASTTERLHDFGVVTLQGVATFENASTVRIASADGHRFVTADYAMIATGSHAFRPSELPFELPGVFESDTIAAIDYLPRRVVVQGGEAVGLEYALVFANLGAEVTVIESGPQILSERDSSLREAVITSLKDAGVQLLVSTSVDSVTKAGDFGHSIAWQPLVNVQAGNRTLESDCFLYSLNWTCSVEGLGLETLQRSGLELGEHNAIVTDERQRTGVDGIYAIGDAAGGGLASVAQAQAITAVKDLVSRSLTLGARAPKAALPAGLWTIPSVAWAGLAEEDAAPNLTIDAVRVPYNTTVRGWISGENGFLKLVYSRKTGEVLGVHMSGETSMELVGFGAEAINARRTIFDLLHDVLPAVTLSQIYRKAAEKAWLKSFKEQAAIV